MDDCPVSVVRKVTRILCMKRGQCGTMRPRVSARNAREDLELRPRRLRVSVSVSLKRTGQPVALSTASLGWHGDGGW